ncbi:hypothetical protein ACO14J_004523 [Vibrio parahaemolyticus]|uniref:hypothetical protein n=1 Tax=Vibrio parahaemolyticus TaxID=670 RepID=UPI0011226E4A|nr:hypothetical protein [Vibrio parahaemolyticus]MBE4291529.1 hypothetical protein [Vibrio parahaemolyticus]TOD53940.1 hypothetical protein CGJ62_22910 [Vibrio parahaemolyticus]
MWYSDWQFWSAIAAFGALVLSQLPPLGALLKKGKLEVKKHTSVLVHHAIGTPNLNLYVSLKNIGGRTTNIEKIQIRLTRDGAEFPVLVGSGYYSDMTTQQLTMFTPIDLGSGEKWSHTVNFHEKWNRTQQQKFRAMSSKVRDTINGKFVLDPQPVGGRHQAEPEQIEEIQNQFNSNFKWLPGEYKGCLEVLDSVGNLLIVDEFKFTLFETESNELKAASNDYRFGYGVHLPISDKQFGLSIELTQ